MRRKLSITLLSILTSFSGLAVAVGTLSWFIPLAKIAKDDSPISGSSSGAYFAYGNGTPTTQEHPENRVYGITVPRHLYNLAWLQYLGFFNDADENGKQYYFELGDNIDMTGWTLPPIGTEDNPFIGNFNGNGYVVKGLTVSNKFSDFNRHPGVVTSGNFEQPHIMGFFGVVGDYNGTFASTSEYSSAANEFSNTGLTGLTIKTYLRDSLMGVAAGYVSGNMKNVAVDASTIDLDSSISGSTTSYGGFTENISDFSLVGFTTNKKQVKKVDETIYDINIESGHEFNATEQGDTTGWGGSIDMAAVLNRLLAIRNARGRTKFVYRKNVAHHADGTEELTSSSTESGTITTIYNTNAEEGHFIFLNRNNSGTGSNNNNYALMGGGHYQFDTYYDYASHSAFQITNGTQYLVTDGTSINKTTTSSQGTYWATVDNGKLMTKINDTYYYLRNNNGTLAVTNNSNNASIWLIDDSGSNRQISNGDYCIRYGANNFELVTGTATGTGSPYSIRYQNSNNYLVNNGTTGFSNSTSEAKIWQFSNFGTSGTTTVYTTINGTRYYLYAQSSGGWNASYSLALSTSSTSFNWGTSGNYRRLSYETSSWFSSSTYYLRFANNAWSIGTNNSNNNLTIEPTTYYAFNTNITKTSSSGSISGPDEAVNNSKSKQGMNYEDDDVTYFPLTTIDDEKNNSDYRPADSNTAYVVGGSSLTATNNYEWQRSNVRFSNYFPISNISNDFTPSSGTFTHIYTINDNLQREEITNEAQYERLADVKGSLGSLMKGASNINGLHFMDDAISMNAITKADYVKVNKTEHHNYELPVNSIDFHLKEFGYITFVAGSYYTNSNADTNNSFFSLYQIERNPDDHPTDPAKITNIYEVVNIYQHTSKNKSYSYVYQLTDGTTTKYTKPYVVVDSEGNKAWLYDDQHEWKPNQYENSLPANYTSIFQTKRIKKNNLNSNTFDYHVYYFEIPMNDGEFCLGSVSGGVGCYLMYLDIGANASKVQRTIFREHFSYAEFITAYPDGVALTTLPSTFSKEVATLDISNPIDCMDSACVEIHAGYTSVFTIDRDVGDVTLTVTNQSNAPPVYKGEDITLIHTSGNSTNIPVVPLSDDTKEITRLTYFDINVNLETLTKTVITDTSVNGGTATRTITQDVFSGTDPSATPTATYVYDSTTDQRDDMKIYNTSNGVRLSSAEITNTSFLPIGTVSNTAILTVRIVQNGGAGFEEEILLNAVIDENNLNGKYYIFNDYVITITPDGEDVVIYVQSYSSGKTIYYGTTQVTGANQTITIEV